MNTLTVKNISFGTGIPKICVPIIATTKEELIHQLPDFNRNDIDCLEWRVDFMKDLSDFSNFIEIAKIIQTTLPNKPLLFTFRTKQEGGEQSLPLEAYFDLNLTLAKSGYIDMVDLELFASTEEEIAKQTSLLQSHGVTVVMSNHDFNQTPDEEIIINRLKKMETLGANIAKIAVMPNNSKDVLSLLSATNQAKDLLHIPLVSMSMGKLGGISRISGECFGSCITFGSLNTASAPGQFPVAQLKETLVLLS